MRHDSSSKLMQMAIEYGCKTAKDLARFIREYNLQMLIGSQEQAVVRLSY
jgi:hypothetical protein